MNHSIKNIFLLTAALLIATTAFASESDKPVVKTRSDGIVTEIYTMKVNNGDILRIEFNHDPYAETGSSTIFDETGRLITNTASASNELLITYYTPANKRMNVAVTEERILEYLYDFMKDKSKNIANYKNYKTVSRKSYYNRAMSDFVDNLPEKQDTSAQKYSIVEVKYFIY